MSETTKFQEEVAENIKGLGKDRNFQELSRQWLQDSVSHKYSYNFTWLGRPAIQLPNDPWALQELIWEIRPDLIIETGIALGGSLIFSASMLALLDLCETIEEKKTLDPGVSKRKVLGIDIDIRSNNREAIDAQQFFSRIEMIQGSSIAQEIVQQVHAKAAKYSKN